MGTIMQITRNREIHQERVARFPLAASRSRGTAEYIGLFAANAKPQAAEC
jgi:hypothetical protein